MEFLEALGLADSTIGLLTFLVSCYIAVVTWRRRRTAKEIAAGYPKVEGFRDHFEYHSKHVTTNPYALSINLLPTQTTAEGDVKNYYNALGQKMPTFKQISRPGINIVPGDLEEFLNALRSMRHELDIELATEVHLFVAGPIGAALYIGAVLDNWKLVKIFQRNAVTKQYEFWGTLQK